jgi:hypothetical protein
LVVVACVARSGESTATSTTAGDSATTATREDTPVTTDRIPTSVPTSDGPSALDAAPDGLSDARFPEPLIDTDRLIQGQVPDGIPAIDQPQFVRDAATRLRTTVAVVAGSRLH